MNQNKIKIAILGFDSDPYFLHELKNHISKLGCEPKGEKLTEESDEIGCLLAKGYQTLLVEANRMFPLNSNDLKFLEEVRKINTQLPIVVICPPEMSYNCKQDILDRLELRKVKRNDDYREGWEFSELEDVLLEALLV